MLGSEFCTSGTVPAVQYLFARLCLSSAFLGALPVAHPVAASLVERCVRFWFLHVWYSTSCVISVARVARQALLSFCAHPWVHYQPPNFSAFLGALPVAHSVCHAARRALLFWFLHVWYSTSCVISVAALLVERC